jgi:hypothetical protein
MLLRSLIKFNLKVFNKIAKKLTYCISDAGTERLYQAGLVTLPSSTRL